MRNCIQCTLDTYIQKTLLIMDQIQFLTINCINLYKDLYLLVDFYDLILIEV